MDGRRHPESLTDEAAFERELEALLAVEPSADFAARVRSRVAGTGMSRGWAFQWRLAAAVAMVAAVAGVTLWKSAPRVPGGAEELRTVQMAASSASTRAGEGVPTIEKPATPQLTIAHASRLAATAGRPAPRVSSRGTIDMTLPAVIIADNEARAYAQLRNDIRNARALPPAPAPREAADVDKALAIDPLVIAPIVEVASAE